MTSDFLKVIFTARSHHFYLLLCKGCNVSRLLPWALNILELDLATQSNLHLGSFHLFLFCKRFNQMYSRTMSFSPNQVITHVCQAKFQLQDKLSRWSHHQPSKPGHLLCYKYILKRSFNKYHSLKWKDYSPLWHGHHQNKSMSVVCYEKRMLSSACRNMLLCQPAVNKHPWPSRHKLDDTTARKRSPCITT